MKKTRAARILNVGTLAIATLIATAGCSKKPVVSDGHVAEPKAPAPIDLEAQYPPRTDLPPKDRAALFFEVRGGRRESIADSVLWNHSSAPTQTVVKAKNLQAAVVLKSEAQGFVAMAVAQGVGEYLNFKPPEGCQADEDLSTSCYVQAVFRDVGGNGTPELLLAVGDGLLNLSVNVFEFKASAPEGNRWRNIATFLDGQTEADLVGSELQLPIGSQGEYSSHPLSQSGRTSLADASPTGAIRTVAYRVGGRDSQINDVPPGNAARPPHITFPALGSEVPLVCEGTYREGDGLVFEHQRATGALRNDRESTLNTGVHLKGGPYFSIRGYKMANLTASVSSDDWQGRYSSENLSDSTRWDIKSTGTEAHNDYNSVQHVVLEANGHLTYEAKMVDRTKAQVDNTYTADCRIPTADEVRKAAAQEELNDNPRLALALNLPFGSAQPCQSLRTTLIRFSREPRVRPQDWDTYLNKVMAVAEQARCLPGQ